MGVTASDDYLHARGMTVAYFVAEVVIMTVLLVLDDFRGLHRN